MKNLFKSVKLNIELISKKFQIPQKCFLTISKPIFVACEEKVNFEV